MPSFNFQKQFGLAVSSGLKCTTIRPQRKNPIIEGQTAHLFTGLRTKHCKKIGVGKITLVREITIKERAIIVDGQALYKPSCDKLAQTDGFENAEGLVAWFKKQYGLPFKGILIEWELT